MVIGVLALWAVPFASMHVREAEESLTDTLHLVGGAIVGPLLLAIIGFGAAMFGKWYRLYSIATILVMLAFGVWAGLDGPRSPTTSRLRGSGSRSGSPSTPISCGSWYSPSRSFAGTSRPLPTAVRKCRRMPFRSHSPTRRKRHDDRAFAAHLKGGHRRRRHGRDPGGEDAREGAGGGDAGRRAQLLPLPAADLRGRERAPERRGRRTLDPRPPPRPAQRSTSASAPRAASTGTATSSSSSTATGSASTTSCSRPASRPIFAASPVRPSTGCR